MSKKGKEGGTEESTFLLILKKRTSNKFAFGSNNFYVSYFRLFLDSNHRLHILSTLVPTQDP